MPRSLMALAQPLAVGRRQARSPAPGRWPGNRERRGHRRLRSRIRRAATAPPRARTSARTTRSRCAASSVPRRADAAQSAAGSRAARAPPARRSPACWRPRRRPCARTSIRPGTPRCEEASSSSGSRKSESTRRSSTSSRFSPAMVRIWMRSPLTARSSPSTSRKPR